MEQLSNVLDNLSLENNNDNDIALSLGNTGKQSIIDLYEKYKNWIKKIQLSKTIKYNDYNRKSVFHKVADIVIDNETNITGKKIGQKKRKTIIQFVPIVSNEEYTRQTEWLYILTINGNIVKIGGTRAGLKERTGSYLCGHHIKEREKSGHCSNTNAFIYNTFDYYLQLGCKIEMYGYELPITNYEIDVFGKKINIVAQTFHAYESLYLEDYKKDYKMFPILSSNADPKYRD